MASHTSVSAIRLYDIVVSSPAKPYSPNPWKVRYALNFKGVQFATEWVAQLDIPATRKRLGLDPVRFLANGEPLHTLPVLQDVSNDKLVGDSFDIAVYLDEQYPDAPRLFHHSLGLYAAFNAHINSIFTNGVILCTQGVSFKPGTEAQCKAEFCRRANVQAWEQLVVTGEARQGVLDAFKVALGDAAKYFRFSEGPFLGGKAPDYADMIIGGWLMFFSLTVAEWEDIRTWDNGLWGKLHDGLEPYRGTW
ncbi:hypothetical protein B0I35DRAFT_427204 [Stachybotrys elegans]|uniref:GST N-terminal domain-containing protein n=1 Tax=Stachybotrys elegans TaxID=80388 RepID=A0A8K0SW79_9HYPO|nr:hypothetical protein B0I35DRAFT_427204 [Stachybotrys elegans]